MGEFKGQCFVMQPFDHAIYDSLYKQVFDSAIRDAKLEPYRVDNDPGASIPIETIEAEITKSLVCFGEISEDNPNVWFELGYALAREKPLCLVSTISRVKFPFDVQHRKIIVYPKQCLPDDYETLRTAITSRLEALISREESRQQNTQTANALSVVPETSGLAPHELLALTLIFEDHFGNGTAPHELSQSMKRGGYITAATNLAASGLIRKKLVEKRLIEYQDYNEDKFFVTEAGVDWLLGNEQKLNLRLPSATDTSKEITDDDIPFETER
jgi:hypothetical protein